MKKETWIPILIIWTLVISTTVPSCDIDMRDHGQKTADAINESGSNKDWWKGLYKVVEIDECEYLCYNVGSQSGVFTHKGNCKNPIHSTR